MAFRSEMTIPINKDPRTFEQQRSDMFNSLEKTYSTKTSSTSSRTVKDGVERCEASSVKTESVGGDGSVKNESLWDQEIHDWITNRRDRWREDIEQMRNKMIKLEPSRSSFDRDSWDPFCDSSFSTKTAHRNEVREEHTTSRLSNTDGATTSETSKSSSLKTTSGSFEPGSFGRTFMDNKPLSRGPESPTDFWKDAYEVGEDGQVHFKIRFDAKDFKPENIQVTTRDRQLCVSAKQTTKTENSSSTREFSRQVDLPSSVEHEKFKCHLTNDGVLILEAPVKAPEYKQITFKDGLGIKAVSGGTTAVGKQAVAVQGSTGPTVISDGKGGKKIHVEVLVDKVFLPEDFCVRVMSNKIHITGKHENKTATSSSFKEFSRYYEVPETLDPISVTANLINGTLVVEAPLLKD